MKEYLEIIRPLNCLMALVAVFIGSFVSGFYSIYSLVLGGISVFLICGGGMVINDYLDRRIDEIDKPERPIPSGKISSKAALTYTLILFLSGLSFSYLINFNIFLLSLFAITVLIIYSKYLQRVFLIGNLTVSFMVGLSFVYGGLISGNTLPTVLMALIAFFFNTGREIMKDVEDVESDSAGGIKSVAVVFGEWRSKILAIIFILPAIIISFIPYLIGIFDLFYLAFAIFGDIIFVSTIIMVLKNGKVNKIQRLMKIGMIIGLAAFLIGAI